MKKLLEEIFGSELRLYREKEVRLPLYLKDGRVFFDVDLYGQKFVLIILKNEGRFNILSLKKQNRVYADKFNMPAVYGFERVSAFQRKSMIENRLPFAAKNGQIFLPFIGSVFGKCRSVKADSEKIHFTPATQMLFLLMLYREKNDCMNKGQAADLLGITPMSVSRAAWQLKQLGMIEEEHVGTEIRIHRILSRTEAYHAAEEYLLDPVQKTVYVCEEDISGLKIMAGEYALSFRSEFGYPDCKEFAVNKKTVDSDKWRICDPDLLSGKDIVKIQIWRYSPEFFAREDTVDPVSLLCSLKGDQDERIHKCLENIKREIEAWQIEI